MWKSVDKLTTKWINRINIMNIHFWEWIFWGKVVTIIRKIGPLLRSRVLGEVRLWIDRRRGPIFQRS